MSLKSLCVCWPLCASEMIISLRRQQKQAATLVCVRHQTHFCAFLGIFFLFQRDEVFSVDLGSNEFIWLRLLSNSRFPVLQSYPMTPSSPSSSSNSSSTGLEQLSKTNLYIRGLPPATTDLDLVKLCHQWVSRSAHTHTHRHSVHKTRSICLCICIFTCKHCRLVFWPNWPLPFYYSCKLQRLRMVASQTNCCVSSAALITNGTTQEVAFNLKAQCKGPCHSSLSW